jgi:hypothetical protein
MFHELAEILGDMDKEIRAVEEKLSKARTVKAGMMSALSSGSGQVGMRQQPISEVKYEQIIYRMSSLWKTYLGK